MSVLIVTVPDDHHAHAVRWALQKLGQRVEILYPLDLSGGAEWGYRPKAECISILKDKVSRQISFSEYNTVWMRRPLGVYPQPQIEDIVERSAAEGEFAAFADGVLCALEYGKFVVNPRASSRTASHKTLQLSIATRVGLDIPDTLIGNYGEAVLDCYEKWGGEIVYKPLRPTLWSHSDGNKNATLTNLITDRSVLLAADLKWGPGIFQKKIEKAKEIRAIFMGRSVFAWEKSFHEKNALGIDWRPYHRGAIQRRHELPRPVVEKCHSLMDQLGLVFGCVDFAVDEDGQYIFFEINPQGQFLWGDSLGMGLNLLEAFAEFLITGDINYCYSGKNAVSWDKFISNFDIATEISEEMKNHFGGLSVSHYNQVCVAL